MMINGLTDSTVTSPTPTLGLSNSPITFPNIGTPPTVLSSPIVVPIPIYPFSPPTLPVTTNIARSEYKSTTSMSCDLLKLHKLIENGGDNKKRKEMILTILGGEDLLSMLNGTRSKPIATSTNPSGFTDRRIIVEANGEDAILNADDVFFYLHDSRRLYIAITIAISESLQYMFPAATSTRNGVLLWDLAIQHLFGTSYDDILEASDRLRRWHIDPSKNLKHDLHILSQLIERVNETSQHDIAESQILAIINKEILKDPREGLRIIAINSSINKTSLNNMLNMLNESSYVLPFNSKVKINELKVSTNKGYCNKFQIGKCTFGEKCRYRHEIDPDYKKKDDVIVGKGNKDNNKDRNKNKDKNNDRKPSKDGHKLYTPNNYNNRVVGPPKGKVLEGQPPRYSNQQQKFFKLFIKLSIMAIQPNYTTYN